MCYVIIVLIIMIGFEKIGRRRQFSYRGKKKKIRPIFFFSFFLFKGKVILAIAQTEAARYCFFSNAQLQERPA